MNWKYMIGSTLSNLESMVVKRNSKFIRKHYPYGRDWIYDISRRYMPEPRCIIDVGANVGDLSKALSAEFPKAVVYSFEPVQDTFDTLVRNIKDNERIVPEQQALSNNQEEITIYLNPEHTINSLNSVTDWVGSVGEQRVMCNTIDNYCISKNIQSVDILKIDVEGFELQVLEGAAGMLSKGLVKTIFAEVGFEREPNKVHFSEVEAFMEKNNFRISGIYDLRRNLFDKSRLWYANFLYVHSSQAPSDQLI